MLAVMPTFDHPSPAAERRTPEALVEAHRGRIFRLGLRLGGGDVAFAEDLAQDVLLKLLEALPRLTDLDDVGAWLYRVTMNAAISRLRRERSVLGRVLRALRTEPRPAPPGPEALVEQREEAAAALATLRTLPARERVVLCMKLLDGRSQQEIAELLALSEGYVSKLLGRAWDRIRAAGWEMGDATP